MTNHTILTPSITQAIIAAAKYDAALFASEFPGETLKGSDWDSEAYAMLDGRAAEAKEALGGRAWELYSMTLRREVERLSVTDEDIEQLRAEAAAAGDQVTVDAADIALGRVDGDIAYCRATCVQVIADARAQADDE